MAYYGTAMSIGILIGMFGITFLYIFILKIEELRFRQYFKDCKDDKKGKILLKLDIIETNYKELAEETNCICIKRKVNDVCDFLSNLYKYRMN